MNAFGPARVLDWPPAQAGGAIPVIFAFARSGGTLVNQLLGVHPKCMVLSEVNPAASCKPVSEQACEWLGLVSPDELAEFARAPYRRQIALLHERAQGLGKRLVVRDWVTVNFLPATAGPAVSPSGQLEQALYLSSAGMVPLALVVCRRSSAVYRSIRRSFPHLESLALEEFAPAYLRYARAVADLPRCHLEALQASPVTAVEELLQRLGLDPTDVEGLLRRFPDFADCTGNTTLRAAANSSFAREILRPPPADTEIETSHPSLAEADALLGYEQ